MIVEFNAREYDLLGFYVRLTGNGLSQAISTNGIVANNPGKDFSALKFSDALEYFKKQKIAMLIVQTIRTDTANVSGYFEEIAIKKSRSEFLKMEVIDKLTKQINSSKTAL